MCCKVKINQTSSECEHGVFSFIYHDGNGLAAHSYKFSYYTIMFRNFCMGLITMLYLTVINQRKERMRLYKLQDQSNEGTLLEFALVL